MRRLALLMAAVPLLASCGSDDGGSGDSPDPTTPTSQTSDAQAQPTVGSAPTPEEQLEQAYRTYVRAFLTGDAATAYQLLSDRCRDAFPLSDLAEASEHAADVYGEVDYTINRVEVNGSTGSVDATFAVEAFNDDEGGTPWLLEGRAWHSDRCGD